MSKSRKSNRKIFCPLTIIAGLAAFIFCALGSFLYVKKALSCLDVKTAESLNQIQTASLKEAQKSYEDSLPLLNRLPYSVQEKDLDLYCKAAILIDAKTGSVIYEQNADQEIPPASMTKLVEMYVVYEAIDAGQASLTDIVPLPEESWAQNLPWDASRMGLDQNHIVTLDELLLGLAIPSANDASIAIASYIAGSMDAFVERMNKAVSDLGLSHTHFVESSGYSELNVTTPREFAAFCKIYVEKYPWALEKYHSKESLRYPQENNLPSYQMHMADTLAYTQHNTNKLLGRLKGVDGLKTGYIDESGYNLALTAKRENTRFISVTMGGPGHGTSEGNRYRNADGTSLMTYAFSNFADYIAPDPKSKKAHKYTVALLGTKEKSLNLVPAKDETFTVPFITGSNVNDSVEAIKVSVELPQFIEGQCNVGDQYGTITYSIGKNELYQLPLVADRSTSPLKGLAKARAKGFALVIKAFAPEK